MSHATGLLTDILAAAVQTCDELATFLQSPEARRRLAPATRYRLYAVAIDRKLQAARIAVDAQVRLQKLAPTEALNEMMELLLEVDTPSLLAVRDRIAARYGLPARDPASGLAAAVFEREDQPLSRPSGPEPGESATER
jgi:hypothetical protein